MKDQISQAKSMLLDALRRAEREQSSKRVIRKLEKLIGELEILQHSI